MWRTQRATSEAVRPSTAAVGGAAGARPVRQQHSAPEDEHHQDLYEVHRIIGGAGAGPHAHIGSQPPPPPTSSVASNYESSTRQQQQRAIANAYFGPSSQATDIFFETDQEDVDGHASYHDYYSHASDDDDDDFDADIHDQKHSSSSKKRAASDVSPSQQLLLSEHNHGELRATMSAEEATVRRKRRKDNQEKFKRIARLADAHRPVSLSTFTRKSTRELTRRTSSRRSHVLQAERKINTELLEAYVAYARSIGHEPQIDVYGVDEGGHESDQDGVGLVTGRASFIQPRKPVVKERKHAWTDTLGTRHSKQRGCLQFWAWLCIGIVVSIIMAFFLAHLSLNEVLHLDAFVKDDVVVTDDFTYLYLRDEVSFRIKYDISSDFKPTPSQPQPGNESYFQVLLLYEDDFEAYVDGEPFSYIAAGSTLRTTYASLALTYIENDEQEEIYFVVQPCVLPWNPSADYCQKHQLPTRIDSGRKVYKLKKTAVTEATTTSTKVRLAIKHLYVNPMPNTCSESGWQGGWYLLIFLPYVVLALFGLRVFQMAFRCESYRANLERKYQSEFAVPENEVDYWQPMPWDRKVPKTRLLGPCCWKKMRKPFEPFYTWWRHENYFTWIFFPYRNERLARGERAIIVFCSLYLTFYVLFVLVMLRDAIGSKLSVIGSVLLYYVLIMLLPSLGKAIFKEIFKLIFRQRRKYFRVKAAGGDTSKGFSFRLAFFLQLLVAVLITCTQLPMFYIWLYRSCEFLKQFMYFGLLAAVTRLSILGVVQDYVWYLVIKTWGWRDLCPYCTERLVHCDCFNDELLVLSVERVGPKWELIMLLDGQLAKQSDGDSGYTAQFDQYTAEQLHERWQILVERAETHMEKVEKLRAYQEKKHIDRMRRQRQRSSFITAASFLSFRGGEPPTNGSGESGVVGSKQHQQDSYTEDDEQPQMDSQESIQDAADLIAIGGCCLREKKVLALNSKIKLDRFEKHYDSTIVDVFHSIQSSLARRRRHRVSREQRRKERHRRHALRRQREGLGSEDMLEASDVSNVSDINADIPGDGDGNTTVPMTSSGGGGTSTSNSSGSIGETMWIFDSPRERLERRELEKQRRKRAFRVLDDYFIETVEPAASAPEIRTLGTGPAGEKEQPAPPPGPPLSRQLTRKDSKLAKLLARQKATPRDEDLVVVVDAAAADVHVTIQEEDHDDSGVEAGAGRGARASGYESADSSGDSLSTESPPPPAPQSRAYAVVERKPSLLRKASTSATSFASWVFRFDQNADV